MDHSAGGAHGGAVFSSGEALGRVIAVSGSHASIGFLAAAKRSSHEMRATVGKFVGIASGRSLLVGVITEVSVEVSASLREQGYFASGRLDLLGEIKEDNNGQPNFQRGLRE